jgi:hypothetical protein
MDDILSGGRIDESTSGPTPPSRDDRGRDILSEQKEGQDQDAIGGTQFPARAQPLPPILEAAEVAPPLPVIPSFDFNISGSALEEFREISRQTTMDILKNVNINGQSPSFEGSTISFNIPQQPPASEAFIFQGIMVPQPLPQVRPIQTQTQPQQPPASEVLVSQEPMVSEPIIESSVPPPLVALRPPQTQPETQIQSFDIDQTDEERVTTPAVLPEVSIPVGTDDSTATPPQEPPVSAPSEPPATTSIAQPETETPETPTTGQQTPETPTTIQQTSETPTTIQQTSEAIDSFIERIVSRIPENEPITATAIRSALREEGAQTTQRAWSNYIDPQAVKDAIEEKREARTESNIKIGEALEVTGGRDEEKIKDYYAGNTPFPPLVEFQVCVGTELQTFLIPAFGPY